jgi:amino acid adenylation domain-containing protein
MAVGLRLALGAEHLTVLLAAMRAGCTWVALDPDSPPARLRAMCEDAGVGLVVGPERDDAPLGPAAVTVGRLMDEHEVRPLTLPHLPGLAGLAYVMFTSGSTGRPKGVAVERSSLNRYLDWCCDAYSLDRETSSFVLSPPAVDLTLTSLLAPLYAGGRVVFPAATDLSAAVDELAARRTPVTLLKLTPSHVQLILARRASVTPTPLATAVVVGGEQLTAELIEGWRNASPGSRVFNEYGPTEATVGCCVDLVADRPEPGPLPIGRPAANTRLYVLDDDMRPLPLGVPGELYIGGGGLARGYVGRPDWTAAAFRPDPFGWSGRLYRTGDRSCLLEDGRLVFLGRSDRMVKHRGFRVELDELDTEIRRIPGVLGAFTRFIESPTGGRLVSYVHSDAGWLTAQDVRQFLRQRLPAYAVPAQVLVTPDWPLSAAGKLLAARLPDIPPSSPAADSVDILASVLGICSEILQMDVDADDDFLDVGGNSLIGTVIMARIHDRFDVDAPVSILFESLSFREVATVVQELIGT